MPISAALLRPLDVAAAAAEDIGGGGAADVDDADADADVEDAKVEEVAEVSWAVADLTAPAPDCAAPIKALSGFVVVASCARALPTLNRATRAGRTTCLSMVAIMT